MESYKKQKLTKVKVQGFKSIRDQEVDLRRLNVFIGGNGAGKSSFFDVFTILEKICQKQLGLYSIQQGIDNLLYYGRKRTDHISMEFAFGEDGIYGFDLVPTEDGRLIFNREFYGTGLGSVSNTTEAHSESVFAEILLQAGECITSITLPPKPKFGRPAVSQTMLFCKATPEILQDFFAGCGHSFRKATGRL